MSQIQLINLTIADLKCLISDVIRGEMPNFQTREAAPKYLNPVQLSELTGWKLSTVYQNHHNGMIPGARKVGARLLFEREIILQWIESGAVPTHAEKVKSYAKKSAQ
jgi:predicted DNA-binding transcriptional regulator AlpA